MNHACQHQLFNPRGQTICGLGYWGGKEGKTISQGTCRACIARGDNTPERFAELESTMAKAFPAKAGKISGCCDSALNSTS